MARLIQKYFDFKAQSPNKTKLNKTETEVRRENFKLEKDFCFHASALCAEISSEFFIFYVKLLFEFYIRGI